MPYARKLSVTAFFTLEGSPTIFIISSATLKKLDLRVAPDSGGYIEIKYIVVVVDQLLEYVNLTAGNLGLYGLKRQCSLKEVKLDIFYADWTQVDLSRAIHLLNGVGKTRVMTLSAGILAVSSLVLSDHSHKN